MDDSHAVAGMSVEPVENVPARPRRIHKYPAARRRKHEHSCGCNAKKPCAVAKVLFDGMRDVELEQHLERSWTESARRWAMVRAAPVPLSQNEIVRISFQMMVDESAKRAQLTKKETTVLNGLLDGLSNRQIGQRLGNSEKTIKHHVDVIMRAFAVESRLQIFATILGRRTTP